MTTNATSTTIVLPFDNECLFLTFDNILIMMEEKVGYPQYVIGTSSL